MQTTEKKLQTETIKFLKDRGAVVIKLSAMPGVPTGMPDILFLTRDHWGFLEVKASATSHFQPLQKYQLERLDTLHYAKVIYPENKEEIFKELKTMIE